MNSTTFRGGTVLAQTGDKKHLHIICSEPAFYSGIGALGVLVVNITSVDPERPYDTTCVLHPGDHPFIEHDSYVLYAKAVVWKTSSIENRILTGEIVTQPPLKEPVISNVISGFLISPMTNRRILNFCRNNCIFSKS